MLFVNPGNIEDETILKITPSILISRFSSDGIRMNVSWWEKEYHKRLQEEFGEDEWREKESSYASYAYDATWVYARALEKYVVDNLVENIHTPQNTKTFMKILKEVTFQGVSGNLAFKKNTSKSGSATSTSKSKRSLTDDALKTAENCPGSDSSDREDTFVYLQQNFLGGKGNKKVAIYEKQRLKLFGVDVEKDPGFAKIQWPNGEKIIEDKLVEVTCEVAPLDSWLGLDDGKPGCDKTVAILHVFGAIVGFGLIVFIFFIFHKKLRRMKENANRMNGLGILGTGHPCLQLDDWEIPRENIVINRKLGEGAFGKKTWILICEV